MSKDKEVKSIHFKGKATHSLNMTLIQKLAAIQLKSQSVFPL